MNDCLIVEDIRETRLWLAEIVVSAFPHAMVHQVQNTREAMRMADSRDFDLALIDLGLPDGSGLEVLRDIKHRRPDTVCVITTVMGDDTHIVAALSAGAQGYLLKEQPAELLSRQLRQLSEGVPALSPSIARRIMEHFQRTGPIGSNDDDLSEREKQTLALISRGFRNCEVASQLDIAESTVASHIKSIYRKLGICSRAEAAWHATRLGL